MHWDTLNLKKNSQHCYTDRRWTRLHSKTPPAKKTPLLTTLSSSLMCESAAEHHTAEQYSKTGRTQLQKGSEKVTDRVGLSYNNETGSGSSLETANALLNNGHLSINRHHEFNKVSVANESFRCSYSLYE